MEETSWIRWVYNSEVSDIVKKTNLKYSASKLQSNFYSEVQKNLKNFQSQKFDKEEISIVMETLEDEPFNIQRFYGMQIINSFVDTTDVPTLKSLLETLGFENLNASEVFELLSLHLKFEIETQINNSEEGFDDFIVADEEDREAVLEEDDETTEPTQESDSSDEYKDD